MKIPRDVSGRDAAKALGRAGFVHLRTTGSHYVARKGVVTLVIPLHRELRMGTLKALIEQSGLTIEEFCDLL